MKKLIKLILCLFFVFGSSHIEAKGFLKKLKTVALWNPIKASTNFVTGANPLIPTNIYDAKTEWVDNFSVVQKGALYRSGQLSAKTLDSYIKEYGIKTVVNLRGAHHGVDWWEKEAAVAKQNNVCFLNISMAAGKLTSKKNLRTILDIFDTAPRPLLVHCQWGADRTGEVAALWVLDQQHKSRRTALKQLTPSHHYINFIHPAKEFLIKIWRGRTWLENEYNPADFPDFEAQPD